MNNCGIVIKTNSIESRFYHQISEEWVCGSFDDAKTVLKEIFDIPSSNGMDDENKIVLTDDDLERYSDALRRSGLDDGGVKTEYDRIRKDQRTYAYACRWIKGESALEDSCECIGGKMMMFITANDVSVKIIVVEHT